MHERVRSLFKEYCDRCMKGQLSDYEPEYGMEVSQRLEQMSFMVDRIKALTVRTAISDRIAEVQYLAYVSNIPAQKQTDHEVALRGYREQLEKMAPLEVNDIEIRVLNEAYYYCAFRARQVIQKLPGLTSFESVGVRDVRNKLLEHPEKQSTVIENGFSFGFDCGPVIKGVRRADKFNIFPDQGLYVNAQEFVANLETKLLVAIK